jgi:hypothetical protein
VRKEERPLGGDDPGRPQSNTEPGGSASNVVSPAYRRALFAARLLSPGLGKVRVIEKTAVPKMLLIGAVVMRALAEILAIFWR